jgi:hypothetical protein
LGAAKQPENQTDENQQPKTKQREAGKPGSLRNMPKPGASKIAADAGNGSNRPRRYVDTAFRAKAEARGVLHILQ